MRSFEGIGLILDPDRTTTLTIQPTIVFRFSPCRKCTRTPFLEGMYVRAIGSREQYSTYESDSFCRTPPPKVAFFLRQCRFFYGRPAAISFCCIIGRLAASTSQIDHVYPFQLVLSHVQGIKESAPGRELPSSQQFELLLGYQFDPFFHL